MVVACPVRSQLRVFASFLLLGGLPLLAGCSHSSPAAVTSISARTAPSLRTVAAPVSSTPQQNALAAVQTLPLYQQAQQACKIRDFRSAASLLSQLASSSSLSAEQVAFVQEQRDLCLHDAGLPLEARQGDKEKRRQGEPTANHQPPTRIAGLAPERIGHERCVPVDGVACHSCASAGASGSSASGGRSGAVVVGDACDGGSYSRHSPLDGVGRRFRVGRQRGRNQNGHDGCDRQLGLHVGQRQPPDATLGPERQHRVWLRQRQPADEHDRERRNRQLDVQL